MIVGSQCESTCDRRLINVFCSHLTKRCECEKNYPVKIGNYVKDFVTAQLWQQGMRFYQIKIILFTPHVFVDPLLKNI